MKQLPLRDGGRAVGGPIRDVLVASFFGVALLSWLAATIALVIAAPDLAGGDPTSRRALLATHLVTLGVLPFAVVGAAFHLLPVMLRNELRAKSGLWVALALLGGAFLAAPGIALGLGGLAWPGAALLAAGLAVVVAMLLDLLYRAPRGRMLVVSRAGVGLSLFHVVAALSLGAMVFAAGDDPVGGVPHDRWLVVHVDLGVLGWLTLLIVAVGRTLGPMLALAPAAPQRKLPWDELALTAGLWLLLAGIASAEHGAALAGGALLAVPLASFGRVVARAVRARRGPLEAPLFHLAAGLAFLAQAGIVGALTVVGSLGSNRGAAAYVVLLLGGWAVGVVVGHLGKLLSLSIWVWWPPGPRPKQAELYPRRLWLAQAIGFAAGVELLAAAVLAGSAAAARAGAGVLVAAAVLAALGAGSTWRRRAARGA